MSIENYNFNDVAVKNVKIATKDYVITAISDRSNDIILFKDDAIALAKHFGLTKEDIRVCNE